MAQYVEEPDHVFLAEKHLEELRGFAGRLRELSATDKEEFLMDGGLQAIAERNLHGALEAAMGAATQTLLHLKADLPNRYAQLFASLAAQGAIDPELASRMGELEEIHDILVHGPMSWPAVHEQLSSGDMFMDFSHQLAGFLEINL